MWKSSSTKISSLAFTYSIIIYISFHSVKLRVFQISDKPYLFLDLVELDYLVQDVLVVLDSFFLLLMEVNEVL